MSEKTDKLRGIDRLPIFPLPLVLLPNEMLPLHIFEDRYQTMLADVSRTGNMFGIIHFESAEAFTDRPETGTIGCVAEIRENKDLGDGRANIVTLGTVRFRLLNYADAGTPYLMGEIEFFEDVPVNAENLESLANETFELFERVARAAFSLSGNRGNLPEISRTDPESFSFLTAAAFSFDNGLKYQLLQTTSTVERLERLREVLVKAAHELESGAEIQKAAKTNGHINKKIEL
ncbi:MAG: LON peptidase substrate-binding domain-containing protein [Acidobacteriota bacterium]